jgi:AcrR family transcriptional regulator
MTNGVSPTVKRNYDPQQMRSRILDVAAGAFQSRGYHSTSMHDIVRLADLSGGALYHHFPTKKALGLAVIRERVSREIAQTWIEPLRSPAGAADAVLAVFETVISELDERAAVMGCPLNNLGLELILCDPEFRVAVDAVFDSWRAAIVEKLCDDQSKGKFAKLNAEEFATFVVASFSGAMGLAKAAQNTGPLRSCARQLARAMAQQE